MALFHILASFWDQFCANVLRGEGQAHQVLRDLGFMSSDLVHLALPWRELARVARQRGCLRGGAAQLVADRDAATAAVTVAALWMLSACIPG